MRPAGLEPAILHGASFQSWCVYQFRHGRMGQVEATGVEPAGIEGLAIRLPANLPPPHVKQEDTPPAPVG